jgi:hypothetical protein
MGPRLRGDDGFTANTCKTVILAQARTHTTCESQRPAYFTTFTNFNVIRSLSPIA